MRLTENFTTEELTATKTGKSNTPSDREQRNLLLLASCILQPLRTVYGNPVSVTSGYRSEEVNRTVGGTAGSQHTRGEAADITTWSRKGNRELFRLIQSLNLPFDQLIDENDYAWIHVSYSGRHRRQVLHL